MNVACASQGIGLRFLHQLTSALGAHIPVEQTGYYVCDSMFHRQFRREQPAFAAEPFVLAEWEIMGDARTATIDRGGLRRRELAYRAGPLWDALVCDRRIMNGRWCKIRQDYRPRFDHDELLRILSVAVERVERWLDAVRPDVVLGFVPVSFGEYLIWMAARSRGIPTLFLSSTKIRNYMCWMDSFFGQPDVLTREYAAYQRGRRDAWIAEASAFIEGASDGTVRHEGMVALPGAVPAEAPTDGSGEPSGSVIAAAARILRAEYEYWSGVGRTDNHVTPPLETMLRRRVQSAARRRAVTRVLRNRYLSADDLETLDYAFYPLHAEPEIALSIQGRPYVNQIETMRNLARSLPAGMLLLTKDHPRSIGYHPPAYYERLLEIPNLRLVDPYVESRHVVRRAALIACVWSFVGFEGVLQRRPVLSFGSPPYTMLPSHVVRRSVDLNRLHEDVASLLAEHSPDPAAVVHYVAACMKASAPLDLYTRFLGKQGRFGGAGAADGGFDQFVHYTLARIRDVVTPAQASA